MSYLPKCETRGAEEMAAGFYPDVFAVLGANLAQLKGRPHLAVELVLLLRHLDVVFRGGSYGFGKVGVLVSTVRVQITEKPNKFRSL